MAGPPPTRGAPMDDTEEGLREGHREDNTLVIPEDGHGWKKYGQKFIKNIGKTRSYFKCHKRNCRAKKRVEWSALNPESLKIIYEGEHTHPPWTPQQAGSSQEEASSASRVNQYDLYTQFFGDQSNSNNP